MVTCSSKNQGYGNGRGNNRIFCRWWQRVGVLYLGPGIEFQDDITLATDRYFLKKREEYVFQKLKD